MPVSYTGSQSGQKKLIPESEICSRKNCRNTKDFSRRGHRGYLSECKKDFQPEEIEGKYLWITIEATDKVKKGKWITFDGFEKYEGKAKPKKEEVEEDMIPF